VEGLGPAQGENALVWMEHASLPPLQGSGSFEKQVGGKGVALGSRQVGREWLWRQVSAGVAPLSCLRGGVAPLGTQALLLMRKAARNEERLVHSKAASQAEEIPPLITCRLW
jgi:hypothetical protein